MLCDETLDEVEEVARFCFERDVPVNFSVVHERGRLHRRLQNRRYLEKLAWLRAEKQAGRPVATPYFLLDYYVDTLNGGRRVDLPRRPEVLLRVAEGRFHFCYHVPAVADLAAVTAADLARWAGPKGCEQSCGVDCVIHTSMPFSSTAAVVASEGLGRIGAAVDAVRRRLPITLTRSLDHDRPPPPRSRETASGSRCRIRASGRHRAAWQRSERTFVPPARNRGRSRRRRSQRATPLTRALRTAASLRPAATARRPAPRGARGYGVARRSHRRDHGVSGSRRSLGDEGVGRVGEALAEADVELEALPVQDVDDLEQVALLRRRWQPVAERPKLA